MAAWHCMDPRRWRATVSWRIEMGRTNFGSVGVHLFRNYLRQSAQNNTLTSVAYCMPSKLFEPTHHTAVRGLEAWQCGAVYT